MMTTSPSADSQLELFSRLLPDSFWTQFPAVQQTGTRKVRKRIYPLNVVIWLMLWQRLEGNASLAAAVLAPWPGRPSRGHQRISSSTGAYCQARQRTPTLVMEQVNDHVFAQLRQQAQRPGQRPVFVVDGTSLQLEHAPALVDAFPPGQNQHGANHWPILRLVVFHDAHTGLATRPQWGPYYGDQPVSEQQLATQGLAHLPANAVVLGDRNFGVFSFAYAVHQSQRPLLLGLTQSRAQKILGQPTNQAGRWPVTWQASRWDAKAHPELPAAASLTGWVVVCKHPLQPQKKLYFFTTLDQSSAQILALYQLRWNIETDLRSLKRTVQLHHLTCRSVDMVEKELLMAVTAYNLIRTVIFRAAQSTGREPRQFSFAWVQAAVSAALPALERAQTESERERLLRELIETAQELLLPRRKRKRPAYPRQVWSRGGRFPPRSHRSPQGERS
jgi:hypothetical protein